MKVLAFVYDFPHFKSAQGLFALKRAGIADVVAVGAPWRRLPIAESHYQFRTVGMADAHHPREAAAALGYEYRVGAHEDVRLDGQLGLVLGARVLPPAVVASGRIVNLHPGVLPLNRGLDTLKWAVHDGLPQAVTAHVIDARVDRGRMLAERIVDVLPNDSAADVYNRLMWAQIDMLPGVLGLEPGAEIERGVYRRPMTLAEDVATQERFTAYRIRYGEICAAYAGLAAAA